REVNDIHKHKIDHIEIPCPKCGKAMYRVPEVFDCWFESGSMPYAQSATKEKTRVPAGFIAEGLDQTRGWFYTLHVLATALFDTPASTNILVNGIVLAEDGTKMSKRKQNYPAPEKIFDNYGADAMRFYLMNSPVVEADDLRFSEKGVSEVVKNLILPLWNAYSFLVTYANADGWEPKKTTFNSENSLDQFILSELEILKQEFTEDLDNYYLKRAAERLVKFIDNLTNWYIRRSRRRFWDKCGEGNKNDKEMAYQTLYQVIITFTQLLAPFCPFISEYIFRNLQDQTESVHLSDWPKSQAELINHEMSEKTALVQKIVSLGLQLRQRKQLKVRQPLAKVEVAMANSEFLQDQLEIIAEELNVKSVVLLSNPEELAEMVVKPNARLLGPRLGGKVQEIIQMAKSGQFTVLENKNIQVGDEVLSPAELEILYVGKEGHDVAADAGIVVDFDTELSPELIAEGQTRDIVRIIQDLRKAADYQVSDRIYLEISNLPSLIQTKFSDYICNETLAEFHPVANPDQSQNWEDCLIKISRIS
ncbi:MAG TPA: class I tRNA ligase family protein, partial [Candidatus Gracilibacteria bacterium]|nr:class I tRNA ligase family protein [Candidatus Gracilibacteria bacterium]